jgi:hypothetical protein
LWQKNCQGDLPVFLSVCLILLSISQSFNLSIHLSVCLMSQSMSVHSFVYMSIHPFNHVCLFDYNTLCLSTHPFSLYIFVSLSKMFVWLWSLQTVCVCVRERALTWGSLARYIFIMFSLCLHFWSEASITLHICF